jgi:hypothetical protein
MTIKNSAQGRDASLVIGWIEDDGCGGDVLWSDHLLGWSAEWSCAAALFPYVHVLSTTHLQPFINPLLIICVFVSIVTLRIRTQKSRERLQRKSSWIKPATVAPSCVTYTHQSYTPSYHTINTVRA